MNERTRIIERAMEQDKESGFFRLQKCTKCKREFASDKRNDLCVICRQKVVRY